MKRLIGLALPALLAATVAIGSPAKVLQISHVAKNDNTIISTSSVVTTTEGYTYSRRFLGVKPAFQWLSKKESAGAMVISLPWSLDRCRRACSEFPGCVAFDLLPTSPGQDTGPGQDGRVCSAYTSVPPSLSGRIRHYKDTHDLDCDDLDDNQVCIAGRMISRRPKSR